MAAFWATKLMSIWMPREGLGCSASAGAFDPPAPAGRKWMTHTRRRSPSLFYSTGFPYKLREPDPFWLFCAQLKSLRRITLRKSLVLGPAVLLTSVLISVFPTFCFAQEEVSSARLDAVTLAPYANAAASPSLPAAPAAAPARGTDSSRRIGVGVKVGTLGVGGEVAVGVRVRGEVIAGLHRPGPSAIVIPERMRPTASV